MSTSSPPLAGTDIANAGVRSHARGPGLSIWRLLIGSAHILALLLVGATWSPWAAFIYGIGLAGFFGYRLWKAVRSWPGRPQLSFTKEGRYMVAITLGVGLAAINTGNNLLYLFLGMLLSMIIVSGVLSELTLRQLDISRRMPRPLFARTPFLAEVVVRNRKARFPSFSLQVEDVITGIERSKRCYFLKIPANQVQRTSYRVSLPRRGKYSYQGVRLSTRFPFGFFVKARLYSYPAEVVVYPKVHPLEWFDLERLTGEGASTRPRKGMGREFHTLRTYQVGDDGTPAGLSGDEAESLGDTLTEFTASLLIHFSERGFRVTLVTQRGTLGIDPEGGSVTTGLHALALLDFEPLELHGEPWSVENPQKTPSLLVSDHRTRPFVTGRRLIYTNHEKA